MVNNKYPLAIVIALFDPKTFKMFHRKFQHELDVLFSTEFDIHFASKKEKALVPGIPLFHVKSSCGCDSSNCILCDPQFIV
jgi:hypothetical protein